ncbi:hypothetical protein AS156_04925 [Bradyrhizobium macuxiense]|uniref:Pilus assembly protein n=1 Tax=Bradyrhizobium macuxiense TaxID=1755647 RepID=A0A120FNX1_9BRAD|nr:hypothetical protein [Bradyrhizobium macuxiense]KWV56046.1 hypothetical protein AS156_04925 [Bradyrhizobium macuxiense]
MSRKRFIADQRGAVAFEMPFVYLFLFMIVLLPLADLGIMGFQFISAFQALRGFGQSIQYSPPPDVTSASTWTTAALAKADANYPISNFQLVCGDSGTVCSSSNTVSPKYYSYTTSITLQPMVLKSVLCTSGNTNPCTFTLPYSERFQ